MIEDEAEEVYRDSILSYSVSASSGRGKNFSSQQHNGIKHDYCGDYNAIKIKKVIYMRKVFYHNNID